MYKNFVCASTETFYTNLLVQIARNLPRFARICVFQVLNEVVVDRGSDPYLCNVDLYIEHKYITTVLGDGQLYNSIAATLASTLLEEFFAYYILIVTTRLIEVNRIQPKHFLNHSS